MGSSVVTNKLVCKQINEENNGKSKVGIINIRLFRPFSLKDFLEELPKTVKRICVLDRIKESGSQYEPLYLEILSAINQSNLKNQIEYIIGGRYGLGSKDYTPSMAYSVYNNLLSEKPKDHFTIGINDDVSNTSLPIIPIKKDPLPNVKQCLFYGVGSDGTTGSNHSAIKIIVEKAHKYGQGYFYYSAHKSGGLTISHLRFGDEKIEAPYLIENSDYTACHHFSYINKYGCEMLKTLKENGIFVINSPYHTMRELSFKLPSEMKKMLSEKNIKLYNIDAMSIANVFISYLYCSSFVFFIILFHYSFSFHILLLYYI